jgi:glutathionylspermidine synthase
MRREASAERPDWRERFDGLGFHFHSADGGYWDERVCYRFDADEIDLVESATEELHARCLDAVEHVVRKRRFAELAIPPAFADYVTQSWDSREPTLFGRFDLSYVGGGESPKLLEYNADTPTSLIEAAVAQWDWLQGVRPDADQFNSLHEKLIERWKVVAGFLPPGTPFHFACVKDNEEDLGNVEYVRDTALQAGIDARFLHVEDIGWDAGQKLFVDLDNGPVAALFKLYPWEWMVREDFGASLMASGIVAIEPAWKMVLSNKGILPILWELFPGHPNLVPAYFEQGRVEGDYVKKPLLSREGANVMIRQQGIIRAERGDYGAEGFVYQAYAPLPSFDGKYPVIGSWIVGETAAGMGIREDHKLITTNTSRFVPHYFE